MVLPESSGMDCRKNPQTKVKGLRAKVHGILSTAGNPYNLNVAEVAFAATDI